MADKKITELPKRYLPVDSEVVVPVVQASGTRKVSISQILPSVIPLATDNAGTPIQPDTGITMYAQARAGRRRPAWIGVSGIDVAAQCILGANKIAYWGATGNSIAAFNTATPGICLINWLQTTGGTLTTRSVQTTNLFTSTRRMGFSAGTGTSVGVCHNVPQWCTAYGFEMVARFGIGTLPNTGSVTLMAGMTSSSSILTSITGNGSGVYLKLVSSPATVSYSAQIVYVANSTETVVQTLTTDFFAAMNSTSDFYEFRLFCAPNSPTINWRVEKLNSTESQTGTFPNSVMPDIMLMSPTISGFCSATSSGTILDVISVYMETDT